MEKLLAALRNLQAGRLSCSKEKELHRAIHRKDEPALSSIRIELADLFARSSAAFVRCTGEVRKAW